MADQDVLIIRRFTQKLAGHNKQANPMAALASPGVLGTLGGAAAGGLGAYGLARLLQSEEDRRNGGMMPMIAGLAGAGLGGYGGYNLAGMLGGLYPSPETKVAPTTDGLPEIADTVNGPVDVAAGAATGNTRAPREGFGADFQVSPETADYEKAIREAQPSSRPNSAQIKGTATGAATRHI
jgi:hypothetical protein